MGYFWWRIGPILVNELVSSWRQPIIGAKIYHHVAQCSPGKGKISLTCFWIFKGKYGREDYVVCLILVAGSWRFRDLLNKSVWLKAQITMGISIQPMLYILSECLNCLSALCSRWYAIFWVWHVDLTAAPRPSLKRLTLSNMCINKQVAVLVWIYKLDI